MADWNQGTLINFLPGSTTARERLFSCPAIGGSPHPSPGFLAITSTDANFDYTFNDQMNGAETAWRGGPIPAGSQHFGMRITRVRHMEHKICLMELAYSGVIAGDPTILDPISGAFIVSLLTTRHGIPANCSFLDGHVERLDPAPFTELPSTTTSVSIFNTAWHHYIEFSSNQ